MNAFTCLCRPSFRCGRRAVVVVSVSAPAAAGQAGAVMAAATDASTILPATPAALALAETTACLQAICAVAAYVIQGNVNILSNDMICKPSPVASNSRLYN